MNDKQLADEAMQRTAALRDKRISSWRYLAFAMRSSRHFGACRLFVRLFELTGTPIESTMIRMAFADSGAPVSLPDQAMERTLAAREKRISFTEYFAFANRSSRHLKTCVALAQIFELADGLSEKEREALHAMCGDDAPVTESES